MVQASRGSAAFGRAARLVCAIALRQENWPEVKNAIERMSPSARSESTWIYWLGRSLCALGAEEDGKALFGRIAGADHFYGQLAAEELEMPLQIPPQASPPTREELERVAALAGLQRALHSVPARSADRGHGRVGVDGPRDG